MTDAPIASVSPSKAAPFLAQAMLLLGVLIWLHFVVAERVLAGNSSAYSFGIIVMDAICARGMFGQFLVLRRSLSAERRALWIEGGRLIYLSRLYAWVPAAEITSVELKSDRRGFGRQPYAVITTRSGRKLHVHMSILNEPFESLRERLPIMTAAAA